ncbi:MAG: hypothetical protein OCD00_07240 [Colwellia sp.]
MSEIHIQKCQHCQSRDLRNILVRDEEQSVYVQCRDCGSLVARYTLSKGGYFHSGKGFESFLRSVERDGGITSARDLTSRYDVIESNVEKEFEALQLKMSQTYGDKLP